MISIGDLGKEVYLKASENRMPGIFISTKRNWLYETIGKYKNKEDFGMESGGFQTEMAKPFQSDHKGAVLASVRIKMSVDLFTVQHSIFRIRVYDNDSALQMPSTELCAKEILVRANTNTVHINLDSYHIVLPHNRFYVAVEWIRIPFNRDMNWAAHDMVYKPSIAMHRLKAETDGTWNLTYENQWFCNKNLEMCMSARVKY